MYYNTTYYIVRAVAKTLFLFHRYRFWGLRCYLPAEVSSRHLQVPRVRHICSGFWPKTGACSKGFRDRTKRAGKALPRTTRRQYVRVYVYIYVYIRVYRSRFRTTRFRHRVQWTAAAGEMRSTLLFVSTKKNNKEYPKIEDVRKTTRANIVGNFRTHCVVLSRRVSHAHNIGVRRSCVGILYTYRLRLTFNRNDG